MEAVGVGSSLLGVGAWDVLVGAAVSDGTGAMSIEGVGATVAVGVGATVVGRMVVVVFVGVGVAVLVLLGVGRGLGLVGVLVTWVRVTGMVAAVAGRTSR
jgi:hypothetical protein